MIETAMTDSLVENMIVIQLIGFIALVISLLVFQVNKRSDMLKLQIVSAALYSIHFLLLGAYTGSAMNVVGAVRNYLFFKVKKRTWLLPGVFIAIFSFVGILTWHGVISLLPVFGMICGTLAFWQKNPKHIRMLALLSPPLWFMYNMIVGSYPGMLTEVIMFASNVVGIYRFDIRNAIRNPKVIETDGH